MKNWSYFLCGLVLGIICIDIAGAQKEAVPASSSLRFDRVSPEVQVVRLVEPSVVSIQTNKMIEQGYRDLFGNWYRMQQSSKPYSQGSGVVIDNEGYVITNEHVVRGADQIKVRFNPKYDPNEYDATVISHDEPGDLALLKIMSEKKFTAVPIGHSNDLMIGERVIAIGNPYGEQNTVTAGILSAIGRDVVLENRKVTGLIQTDASINPGNSGGPLLNINGELIGINNAIHPLAEGIGFAIPVDRVVEIINSHLLNIDETQRIWFGAKFGKSMTTTVEMIEDESPAERAGLAKGDQIIAVNGKDIDSFNALSKAILSLDPGQKINLTVQRRGSREKLAVELAAYADKITLDRLGLQVETAQSGDQSQLRVTRVVPNGPADRIGIQEKDILRGFTANYRDAFGFARERTLEVRNPQELVDILNQIDTKSTLGVVIYRNGEKYKGDIRLR